MRQQGIKTTILKAIPVVSDHVFDYVNKVETCAFAQLEDLSIKGENRDYGAWYQPSRVITLRKMFRAIQPLIPHGSVLVDFGCGKGRVLLIGSEFGFKEVRGVEFASELVDIARRNCFTYERKVNHGIPLRVFDCDAVEYVINADENVFFFNNPFEDVILNGVLSNIFVSLEENPRKILIIYEEPVHDQVLYENDKLMLLEEKIFFGHLFKVYTNVESRANIAEMSFDDSNAQRLRADDSD